MDLDLKFSCWFEVKGWSYIQDHSTLRLVLHFNWSEWGLQGSPGICGHQAVATHRFSFLLLILWHIAGNAQTCREAQSQHFPPVTKRSEINKYIDYDYYRKRELYPAKIPFFLRELTTFFIFQWSKNVNWASQITPWKARSFRTFLAFFGFIDGQKMSIQVPILSVSAHTKLAKDFDFLLLCSAV